MTKILTIQLTENEIKTIRQVSQILIDLTESYQSYPHSDVLNDDDIEHLCDALERYTGIVWGGDK